MQKYSTSPTRETPRSSVHSFVMLGKVVTYFIPVDLSLACVCMVKRVRSLRFSLSSLVACSTLYSLSLTLLQKHMESHSLSCLFSGCAHCTSCFVLGCQILEFYQEKILPIVNAKQKHIVSLHPTHSTASPVVAESNFHTAPPVKCTSHQEQHTASCRTAAS